MQEVQKIMPEINSSVAEMNPTYTAPPGSCLLLSGTVRSRKFAMISFVYHTVGIKPETPADTKQTPPAKAAWLFVSPSPPKRVHFIPTAEAQIPSADRTQARTMVARAACTCTGRDRIEYLRAQLNIPVLYHVQSIHSPCSCSTAVMMLEPESTLTFQLGSRVAVSTPDTPDRARAKASSWSPADAMPLPLSVFPVTWCLTVVALIGAVEDQVTKAKERRQNQD